jgi:hypothetical protein
MSLAGARSGRERLAGLTGATELLLRAQQPNGAIDWFEDGGAWDAWNHSECLMALAVMGELEAARRGFDHLAERQETDGSWICGYGSALPMADEIHVARAGAPLVKDANFAAYPAVALWHLWRLTGERADVDRWWPTVRAGIAFVLGLQHPEGDISWSGDAHGAADDDALLAGNASIFKSLECALWLAELVGDPQPLWAVARQRLREAVVGKPHRFNRDGVRRGGFAMDWYYPALAGVLERREALARLLEGAPRFIVPGVGCRCVDDQPWMTVAETCELAMALFGLSQTARGARLLEWIEPYKDETGAYWMGWQFEAQVIWPEERPTWTQAAAILAHDALLAATPAFNVILPG